MTQGEAFELFLLVCVISSQEAELWEGGLGKIRKRELSSLADMKR